MNTSQQGIELIKSYEGFRTKAYQCSAGVWTIGYGHPKGVKAGDVITEAQAEEMLKQDIASFENDLNRLVKVNVNQHQFDALISLVFNIGTTKLTKSTLLKKLNAADYQGAANEFLRWNNAGGKASNGLTKRRKAEQALFNQVA